MGLNKTATSRKIINSVDKVKNGVNKVSDTVITTVGIAKGLRDGTVKPSALAGKVIKGTGNVTLLGAKGIGKAGFKGSKFIVSKSPFLINKSWLGAANIISQSQDTGIQSIGNALTYSNYSARSLVVAGKVSSKGIKRLMSIRFKKPSLANIGSSVTSLVTNLIKATGRKIVMPIILLACVVVLVSQAVSAPVQMLGVIFGSTFNTKSTNALGNEIYTEYDVRDYVLNTSSGIPFLKDDFTNRLINLGEDSLKINGGDYDIYKIYTKRAGDLEPSEGLRMYSDGELADIIQPIFNAVILKDYELEPSIEEAETELKEIFENIFFTTEESIIEWCGQSEDGTINLHTCGYNHALPDCLNNMVGTHSSFTCETCCDYYCPGHTVTIPSEDESGEDTTETTYCDGCESECSGYSYCDGHNILKILVTMEGIFKLLSQYFTDRIDYLANLSYRNHEQELELQTLRDYYEICLEYIKEMDISLGGSATLQDLDYVDWVLSSRTGNPTVISLALSQLGQIGGQPFWSYYGFSSRVEWCACFVHWAYNVSGYGSDYGYSSNNAYTPTLVAFFKSRDVWHSGGYSDLAYADVIFFDWDRDGSPNHVGLVIGRDAENVYTIEGNSGDRVRIKSYSLNSSVILGYAIFNS